MTEATSTTPAKAKRNRAFLRSYDYAAGKALVKDAKDGQAVVEIDLSKFSQSVLTNLALQSAVELIAGAGVEAEREEGTGKGESAMLQALTDLEQGKVEFRDGVGVSMGGTLKRVGRALTELGKSSVTAPDGQKFAWDPDKAKEVGAEYVGATGIDGAFLAMKKLWDVPGKEEATDRKTHDGKVIHKTIYESGRSRFNRIKSTPEVAAKLASYGKAKTASAESFTA